MPDLSKLIQALPSFKQAELQALKAAIDSLLDAPDNTGAEELFQITVNILGIKSIGYKQFSKTKTHQTWVKRSIAVDNLVDRIIGDLPRSKVEISHLKKFLMQLVIDYLKEAGGEITMPRIADKIGYVEYIFENYFPGYLGSGVPHLILKHLLTK